MKMGLFVKPFITEPDPLSLVFVTDSVVSCQGNDGALSVQVDGGTLGALPFYYTWWTNSNGDTLNNVFTNPFSNSMSNLPLGVYQITVKDAHDCMQTAMHNLVTRCTN